MGSKADVLNECVRTYRSLATIPTIKCANITSGSSNSDFIKVSAIWSQKNLELGETIKFKKDYVIKASSSDLVFESLPTDISSEDFTRISGSGNYVCVVRKIKTENKSKQFIEIWTEKGLYKNFDVSAFDIHGEIYTDGEFGTLEWSPNEEKILYIAEAKTKKSEPFYKQKSEEDKQNEKGEVKGNEYIFKPDWGEQLVDKHQPVLGICDLKNETLKVVKNIPSNYSPGQLLWSKDGGTIFGVLFENEPRRLGLVYCTNRPSYIFMMSATGEFKILSEPNKSVRSPRLSPDGKNLYWLGRPVSNLHNGCQELVKYEITGGKKKVMIDIVRTPGKTFSGLFLHELPRRCFSKDGNKLFFSSCNKLKNCSYSLDLGNKEINLLETGDGSSTILDVHDDHVLIAVDSLQLTPALKISKTFIKPQWIPITNSEVIYPNSILNELELQSKNEDKFVYYNALYYGPPAPTVANKKLHLVLMPHGGPHSAFTNSYGFEPNFLIKLGYGVLLVNYRGSTGVGQDGVEFLPGNVGDTDVKDCHEAVLHVLKTFPYLDEKNVFLSGGSHGGFLVEHLSAQYPDVYRAVAARNPVINIASMYSMSDIPDWATGVCSIKFNEAVPLTHEENYKMVASSPIDLLSKIKIPTLFLIGRKDLRVPFYEGIKMYYCLKAKKVKVRLNLYDDNHTLGNVPNHIDSLINTVLWFVENKA